MHQAVILARWGCTVRRFRHDGAVVCTTAHARAEFQRRPSTLNSRVLARFHGRNPGKRTNPRAAAGVRALPWRDFVHTCRWTSTLAPCCVWARPDGLKSDDFAGGGFHFGAPPAVMSTSRADAAPYRRDHRTPCSRSPPAHALRVSAPSEEGGCIAQWGRFRTQNDRNADGGRPRAFRAPCVLTDVCAHICVRLPLRLDAPGRCVGVGDAAGAGDTDKTASSRPVPVPGCFETVMTGYPALGSRRAASLGSIRAK